MDSRERLKNIIHFICRECGTDPDRLGKVKLHKIVYYSDLYRFRIKAKPIIGVEFVKHQFGPWVAEMDDVLRELEAEGKVAIIPRRDEDEYDPVRLVGKGSPDISAFEAREIGIIREQMDELCPRTATQVSEASHGPVWKMAEMGEPLPLEAEIVLRLSNTTDEDTDYAAGLDL